MPLEQPMVFNSLSLNDHSLRPPAAPWWIKLDRIDGLFDADVRDERFPNPGQDGESSGDLKDGGKTITLAGRVRALTLPNLRAGEFALIEAFDNAEHALYWGYTTSRGVFASLYIRAKKTQKIDLPEQQATNDYQRPFTIQLRADDPRSYSVIEKQLDLPIGATSAGLRTRVIHPVLLDYPRLTSPRTRVYASGSAGGGAATAVNDGPRPSYPTIEVYGPIENPVITNVATGEQLVWSGLTLADGDFISIDTQEGLILRGGASSDYTGFDTVHSDFFQLVPGDNTITVVPFSSGSTARALIRWRDSF